MAKPNQATDDPAQKIDRLFDCVAYLLAKRWIEDHKHRDGSESAEEADDSNTANDAG